MIQLIFSSLALFPFMDPVSHQFTHQGETRMVHVYGLAPSPMDSSQVPIIVALHGCLQSAEDFASLTRLKSWALKGNGLLVTPVQSPKYNPLKCWNWFQGSPQGAPPSELTWLNAMLDNFLTSFPQGDSKRVYLWGLSAGATMAVTWAACSPERFQKVVAHSGTAPFLAFNEKEARQVLTEDPTPLPTHSHMSFQCGGGRGPLPDLHVIHGDKDPVVHPEHGPHLFKHWLELLDWRDDGAQNNSMSEELMESTLLPPSPPGSSYVVQGQCARAHNTAQTCAVELWQISPLGHAWSGGLSGYPFSDPKAPDVSTLLLKSH